MPLQWDYCNLKLLGVQVSFKSAACDCSNSALVLNFIRLMEVSRQLLEVRIFYEQCSKAWLHLTRKYLICLEE